MKQLKIFLFIILILPLLAGFSQANQFALSDCVHCMVRLDVQSSCCQNNDHTGSSRADLDHSAASQLVCPNKELCQGDDNPTLTFTKTSVRYHMVYWTDLSSYAEQPLYINIVQEPVHRPLPLYVSRVRYLLLCSFLI